MTLWKINFPFNYEKALSDPGFREALGRTVLLLAIALSLEMLLRRGLALMVAKVRRGQRTLRIRTMFPMMFSLVLVGFMFKFIFNDNVGLVNSALQSMGLMPTAILILADLFALPQDPLEAAKVDGFPPDNRSAM